MIRKAVFPAAGFGTRFLPATKASPKEMLPLVDVPLIQHGVEEAKAAGIRDMIIVTGRGKNAIEDHFDVSFELEAMLRKKGDAALLSALGPGLAKCHAAGLNPKTASDGAGAHSDLARGLLRR